MLMVCDMVALQSLFLLMQGSLQDYVERFFRNCTVWYGDSLFLWNICVETFYFFCILGRLSQIVLKKKKNAEKVSDS